MKRLLLFFALFALSFSAFAQFEAGEYLNSDTLKNKGVDVYVEHLKLNPGDIGKVPIHQGNTVQWTDFMRDSVNYLDLSFGCSGDTVVNSGETFILFDAPYNSSFEKIEVIAYVRRVSDNAVIDYVISDVSNFGFKISVWEDQIFVGYVAFPRTVGESDIDSLLGSHLTEYAQLVDFDTLSHDFLKNKNANPNFLHVTQNDTASINKFVRDSSNYVTYTGNDRDLDMGAYKVTAQTAKFTTGAAANTIFTGDAAGLGSWSTVNSAIGGNALSSGYLPYWDGSKLANSGITTYGNKFSISADYEEEFNIGGNLLLIKAGGTKLILANSKNSIILESVENNITSDFILRTEMTEKLRVSGSGLFKIANLSGTGTRLIAATSDGTLTTSIAKQSGDTLTVVNTIKKGIENSTVSGVVFTQTANQTVANTTTETTMFGTGIGSLTFPANFFTVGKTVRVKIKGFLSAQNGEIATLKIKLNDSIMVNSAGTFVSLTDVGADIEFDLTCRTTGTTGTVIGQGFSTVSGDQGFSTSTVRSLQMLTTKTINTTVVQTINFTYQWTSANTGNSITTTNASVEVLN